MTGAYVYTPDIWLPLAGAVFLAAIGLHCWRRRDVPAALPLAAVSLFGALWLVGIALEAAAVPLGTKIAWFRFQALWRMPTVTAGLCFVLEYAYPGRWLTRRNLILLSIPVLLDIVLVAAGDAQLIWRRIALGPDGSVVADLAPAGLILTVYGVGLVLANTAVLLWLFIRSPRHRWPVVVILLGNFASRGLYVVDVAHLPWPIPPDPLVVGLLLGATGYAVALFGFHIFDPVPAARRTAIEQMRDGMVVLDPHWRVAAINRAAANILAVSAASARGKRAAEILPAFADLSARFASAEPAEPRETTPYGFEMSLGMGPGVRFYEVDVSSLRDFRGLLMGYLLLLRDVTERRQAEAALRESVEIQRIIFDHAFDGIAIYEEHPDTGTRRLLECNERYAELSGRSRQELLEIGDPALVQKALALAPYAERRHEIEAAQSTGFFSWVRSDGKENIIEYSAATFRAGGRLLTIGLDRDVTERELAEARILEQQRSLAMLREREQLARELHDSIGQVMAYAGLQLEVVHDGIANGQAALSAGRGADADAHLAEAGRHVTRLGSIVEEAHADIREYILNLRLAPSDQRPFFATLRHYLDGYSQNYGIQTELAVGTGVDAGKLDPSAQMQLFRIIQEALSNARKHAGASSVQLAFDTVDGRLAVHIRDNGRGFDPAAVRDADGHFGLRIMHERAEAIGGNLRVQSEPGAGTCVVVELPLEGRGGEGRR